LQREFFEPLGADASLGTPQEADHRVARIYPPGTATRAVMMLLASLERESTEARVFRSMFGRDSLQRRAFLNPRANPEAYDDPRVYRAELAWASATASAHGLPRAYLPFALGGSFEGRSYVRESTLRPIYERQSWSTRDAILEKPVGWSQGFLKEEEHLFSPNPESFGHAGMGGALGFCDPVAGITIGYVMNRMDWRIRSPRALALCRAIYSCEPVRDAR
jgi:CubicO group peptidase (beta-lactamase class C family)